MISVAKITYSMDLDICLLKIWSNGHEILEIFKMHGCSQHVISRLWTKNNVLVEKWAGAKSIGRILMTSIVSLTLFEFRQYPVVWPMKRENMRKVDTLKKTAKLEKMPEKATTT